ncbi:site-specific integrase [Synechococcus sp. CBW1107]|uniref:site-specific integrase n=1 Tax=Synechococcus sp. CBW1107 TaxID=2789857 RepID=UPI002AD2DE60|nr:site-specific integrase [Synechococcus sp. CBW1107]
MSQENARLAASGLALRLERRGGRLALRGPLPCPRGGPQRVQRLSLGLEASPSGLNQARRELKRVSQALRQRRFDWGDWGRPTAAASALERLEDFEKAFFSDPRRRRNPAGSRTTWSAAYQPYLRRLRARLEQGEPLDSEQLVQVLEAYPPASRSRQQCGTALAALARQLELPLPGDWRERAAGYGLHQAQYRRLPSDAQLLEWVERIPNTRWRLVYGLMATYGLRNHEVFFADLSALAQGGDRVIRVLPTTKTGEHQVWPFQPEWVDRFDLAPLGEGGARLPAVCTDLRRTTLQQVGRRVAEQFRRYELPCTPYDLRHAWAVRTIHIGLPDTVAARMMGHSVAIHTRTYHHWITRRDQQQAVDAALARQRLTL